MSGFANALTGGGKTTQSIPPWLEAAGKNIYTKASNFYNAGYKPYTANPRVAGFNPIQKAAFGAIQDPSNYATADRNEAMDWTKSLRSSIPSIADVGRVVDEDGVLGKISDYINPNTDAVLAPAIRDIEQSANAERGRIGDSAMAAHAFGDARHGVRENELARTTETAVGDVSGRVRGAAFDSAMANRGADLNRILTGRTTAAQLGLQGAGQLGQEADAADKAFMDRILAQLGVGNLQQQNQQSRLDARYGNYQARQQSGYDRLAALMSVIQGIPYTRTTQTSTNPLTAITKLIGAATGA